MHVAYLATNLGAVNVVGILIDLEIFCSHVLEFFRFKLGYRIGFDFGIRYRDLAYFF